MRKALYSFMAALGLRFLTPPRHSNRSRLVVHSGWAPLGHQNFVVLTLCLQAQAINTGLAICRNFWVEKSTPLVGTRSEGLPSADLTSICATVSLADYCWRHELGHWSWEVHLEKVGEGGSLFHSAGSSEQ